MRIRHCERGFVYHSPSYPGFTSWAGLWTMPGGALMCSFTQAIGPAAGRPRAPAEIRSYLDWPPARDGRPVDEYDMTGLRLQNVHLTSADGGRTWVATSADTFRSCMNGVTGEAELALHDGTLLRGMWGPYLPYDDVPRTGYMERSADAGATWSGPEVLLDDPDRLFWPKRIRALADGRLLAGGGLIHRRPDHDHRAAWFDDATLALFVADADGRAWRGPLQVVADGYAGPPLTEEFDWAELASGDLLLVIRAGGGAHRLQTVLPRQGDGWRPGAVVASTLPHSGHPELLRTADGAVLHLATTGLSGTTDAGRTWVDLPLDDGLDRLPATPYYPRSVPLASGQVLVVGHVGGDDGYGLSDQAIVCLRFELAFG